MNSTLEIVEQIKHSLDFMTVFQQLQEAVEAEKAKRQEFYDLIHENVNAEFINGEIILHSPVMRRHWRVSSALSARMINHVEENDLGEVGVEKVMIRLTRNDYEPDIVFFKKDKSDLFTEKQLLFPAPDLIVEILSESTKKNDRTIKFEDYARHDVKEYWIIDPEKKCFEQYINQNNAYELYQKLTGKGLLQSMVIDGFFLSIEDVFR
ncbi:MAG: Uma2 family endonuclease [Arcicella sp.]|nr:Uma2 family endonuclease [Arcicella sp.]